MLGAYTPYKDADTRGMAEGLQAGLNAQTIGFKDALAGVDSLLKTAEKGYIEDNTLKVQEYLRNNIKQAGLGAAAPELDQVASQFGKLIDKKAIGDTITSTREGMKTEARDDATGVAGAAFAQSNGDIGIATNAYIKRLGELDMPSSEALIEGAKWNQNNKFLAENIKATEIRTVEDATNKVFAIVRDSAGVTDVNKAADAVTQYLDENLKGKVLAAVKTRNDTERGLTKQDADDITFVDSQATNKIAAVKSAHDQQVQLAKNKFDSIAFVPEAATEAAKTYGKEMGGLYNRMAKDATGLWFGLGLQEGQVPEAMGKIKNQIMAERNISSDDADGILFQAYNDARRVGIGKDNADVPKEALTTAVARYTTLYDQKKAAQAEYTAAQRASVDSLLKLENERSSLLHGLRTGAGNAKTARTEFNIMSEFDKHPFSSKFPEQHTVPFTPSATNTTPGASVTAPQPNEITARADKLRAAAAETKPIADTGRVVATENTNPDEITDSSNPNAFKTTFAGKIVGAARAAGQQLALAAQPKVAAASNGPSTAETSDVVTRALAAAQNTENGKVLDLKNLTPKEEVSLLSSSITKTMKEGQRLTYTVRGKTVKAVKRKGELSFY